MRIISGLAGRTVLKVPPGELRPTTDRVREALFSMLAPTLSGKRFLDLFAGSGAVGLEALSRGAVGTVFVDVDPNAVSTIRANTARTRLSEYANIIRNDVFTWLGSATGEFEFVFADPPYKHSDGDRDFFTDLLSDDRLPGLVVEGGRLIVESAAQTDFGVAIDHWKLLDKRTYGGSCLWFFEKGNGPSTL